MHMIGHLAVADQCNPMELKVLAQEVEIHHAISLRIQDKNRADQAVPILPAILPFRDRRPECIRRAAESKNNKSFFGT
jgi:hypothetical protein